MDQVYSSMEEWAECNLGATFEPTVGGYHMGGPDGIVFSLVERPSWFHRLGVRLVLGWKWEDD